MSRAGGRSRGWISALRGPVRIITGLIGLVVVLGLALAAVLTLGVFTPLRESLVEQLLGAAVGATVTIDGPVDLQLGPVVHISASKIRFEHPDGAAGGAADVIDNGAIGLRLRPLLSGDIDPTSVTLAGVTLAENSTLVEFRPAGETDDGVTRRWLGVIPAMVRLAQRTDVAVSDVRYRYQDDTSGWAFDIVATSITTGLDEAGQTTIDIVGTVNGSAVTIDGDIYPLDAGADAADNGFMLTVSTPGATAKLSSVVTSGPQPSVSAIMIGADVGSIGDLLDLFRVARTIDGTAKLSASIDTSGATSALRGLDTAVALTNGPTFQVSGSIEDLDARTGFDLSLDAQWPVGVAGTVDQASLLAFEIETVTGRLTGDLRALELTDGWITTNLFSDALPWLGPISAGAIRRDDKGRIVVEDLHVLAGPTDHPSFDLKGRIGDLLQLADFRLAGNIAMPTADLIDLDTDAAEAALGRLTGDFAVSDASGAAGIDTLTARLTGSNLLSAELRLTADQSQPVESATFALAFDVPDYARLAAAARLESESIGRIGFKGDVALTPASGTVDGTLAFGETMVTGDASASLEAGRPLIAGTLSSPTLHLDDVRELAEVVLSIRRAQTLDEMSAHEAATHGPAQAAVVHPKFDFDIKAGRIDGAHTAVSGVSGRLLYDRGLATAEAMTLSFEGGRFRFDGSLHTGEPHLPFSVKGNADRWPIGNVMGALDIDLPITGMMAASFDFSSSAVSARTAMREAKGSFYARIVDGEIGNRLIDLSGLVLPSWLFAPSAKTGVSHVECFSAKLAVDPGLAILQSAMVETDDVIVTANGRLDFRNDTIDIEAKPRARVPNLVPIVSPFAIRGSLSNPKVVVQGGGVLARGAAEVLALPFNTIGTLLGVDRTGPKPRRAASEC